jgi:hypothetical protein
MEKALIQNNPKTKLSIKKKFIFIIMIMIPIILFFIIIFKKILYPIFKIKCELTYMIKDKYGLSKNGKNCESIDVSLWRNIDAFSITLSCPSSKYVEDSLLYKINEGNFVKNGEIAENSNDRIFQLTISSDFLLDIYYSICSNNYCYNGKKGQRIGNEMYQVQSIQICLK